MQRVRLLQQMGISRTVYDAWQRAVESRVSEDTVISMLIKICRRYTGMN
jgi:hypothetical protein